MSSPHDPDDDPAAGTPEDVSGGVSDEEAAWRAIVENFGDRHDLGEDDEASAPPDVPPSPRGLLPEEPATPPHDHEDHYVPPPPPPLPRPAPARLLAWFGLFGVPTLVLVCLVARIDLPLWMGLVLMIWFVGGFVYLVASMRPRSGDGYDDGAVL